ncbi:MAG: transcription antitermination factor NusB [Candidatus Amesbacteria bacterium]|nr:transcription antitermination factor NusB [Candidatus Amesbacteria bacterium]
MKTASDPRHLKRVKLMQCLYEATYRDKPNFSIVNIWSKLGSIDPLITKSAPEWPISQINPVDLAILRLATWELVIDKTTPLRVIIDEAVELAHEFGSDHSPSFINGVLGNLTKTMQKRNAVIQFLANEWQKNPSELTDDTILSEMSSDTTLLSRLQDALDITIPTDLSEIITIGDLLEAIDPVEEIHA